jgi:hypothetical protein
VERPAGPLRASASGASAVELIPGFEPENDLERRLASDPDLLAGLAWGKPRSGHPEGSVGAHVADLLDTIERWKMPEPLRSELRFVALVHDSLKNRVQYWRPRTGENHHAMRARRFAERYTDDERLLTTIELHDRPYSIWKKMRRRGRLDEERLRGLLERIDDGQLFMRFVELDGSTEGKNPEPIDWFRTQLERRGA